MVGRSMGASSSAGKRGAARVVIAKKEINDYAASKGVALPSNFYDMMLSQGSDVDISGNGKNIFSFVDSFIQNKNGFYNNAIKNQTYAYTRYMYGVDASAADRPGTSQNNAKLRLESTIKSAALSGVPIPQIQGSMTRGQQEFGSVVQDDGLTRLFGQVAIPIALSFALPGIGSAIGAQLTAAGLVASTTTATAIGTALASTAIQVSQGANFEEALKNATVNAVIQTGAPSVATEINKFVKIPQISDAITSAGASALKTAAAGGSAADIEKNIIGAIAGSATASAVEIGTEGNLSAGRLAGATVGGAVTGGTAGALTNLAGEYVGQKEAERAKLEAQKGTKLAAADTGVMSDSGSLAPTVVTSRAEPGVTDTSIITPTGPISDREVMGAIRPPVNVPSLKEVKVTGSKESPDITDTTIVSPDSLPEVTVKGEKEKEPIAEAPVEEESPVDEQGRYRPNLFIYGGTKPSTLSRTLGTTVQNVPSASTTTGTSVGLGGRGEIESKESGKKRQTVWNEESLRLKDALGL